MFKYHIEIPDKYNKLFIQENEVTFYYKKNSDKNPFIDVLYKNEININLKPPKNQNILNDFKKSFVLINFKKNGEFNIYTFKYKPIKLNKKNKCQLKYQKEKLNKRVVYIKNKKFYILANISKSELDNINKMVNYCIEHKIIYKEQEEGIISIPNE